MDLDRNGRTLSPTSSSFSCCALTATAKRQRFLRRIFKFRQMDFEYALWQMVYLFIAPQKVYRNFGYRKQTKNQWARDDPAFLVLLVFWLLVSSIGFSYTLSLDVFAFLKFLFWVVFVDCIGVGLVIATLLWVVTNRFLLFQPATRCDVEWGYCFDIHLNAFLPLLLILHFIQLPFLSHGFGLGVYISCLIGNTVWLIAIGYYVYITFLGYSSLPFLKKTHVLLYPLTGLFLFYVLSIALAINFNQTLCDFYKFRSRP